MLETIWFALWGILWAVYFMLDGFDLGIGTLSPFLAKSEADKGQLLEAMGPYWNGNEVWLITAGGVTFAAFPNAYAVMFSSLYTPLMLILFALIFRGVAMEYRETVDSAGWRKAWDVALWLGSFLPALLFGVAFANIFEGLPLSKEGALVGGLPALLNPYGLLGGLLFVVLFCHHGALWLCIKTEGDLRARARRLAGRLWLVLAALAVIFLIASWFATNLYDNYFRYPLLLVFPLLAVAGLFLARFFHGLESPWKAWAASSVMVVGCTLYGVAGIFPNLLPSRLDPAASMSITNSASSELTLTIMLVVALIMVPVVIIYQTWAYTLFAKKVENGGHGGYGGGY